MDNLGNIDFAYIIAFALLIVWLVNKALNKFNKSLDEEFRDFKEAAYLWLSLTSGCVIATVGIYKFNGDYTGYNALQISYLILGGYFVFGVMYKLLLWLDSEFPRKNFIGLGMLVGFGLLFIYIYINNSNEEQLENSRQVKADLKHSIGSFLAGENLSPDAGITDKIMITIRPEN